MPPEFRLNFAELEQVQAGLGARFALLGLFPVDYGFILAEACAVWGLPPAEQGDARRSLALLKERKLIEQIAGSTPLFDVPRVVHGLAEVQLRTQAEVRAQGEARLIDYYTDVAAAHSEGRAEDVSAIADVYEAADAALTWAEQAGRLADAAVLARAISHFLYVRRMTSQYRLTLRRGLAAAQQAGRMSDQAWFQREQAVLAASLGQFAEAVSLFEASIAISRELGDDRSVAQGLYEWGRAESALDHYEAARHLMNESMDVMRELHHGVLQPATLHELAGLSIKQGLHAQAQHELEEALNAEIDRGDLAAQAGTLYELGTIAGNRGEAQPAADYLLRSLDLARRRNDRGQGGRTLAALGLIAALANDSHTATRCWLAARALLTTVQAPEAAGVERALTFHLGAPPATLPPDAARLALAEWWGT